MPLLQVRDLEAGYGSIRAIDGVSLDVEAGEIVTVIGSNGAGKSTLLRAVSGIVPAWRGRILLRGRDLCGKAAHRIVREGVSHAPEGRRIFSRLTVRENLELGGYSQPDRWQRRRDISEVCELFPVLGTRMSQTGGTLS
jgi:branched-chain amino acid transport system ATP-binding protein